MLFLSDLDGTLMDSNGIIAEEDVNSIHQWTQKHSFGFVTGRDHAFCMELASKYQLSCAYMITDNGANAYYKDQNVYSSLIDLDDGIQMCKAIIGRFILYRRSRKSILSCFILWKRKTS